MGNTLTEGIFLRARILSIFPLQLVSPSPRRGKEWGRSNVKCGTPDVRFPFFVQAHFLLIETGCCVNTIVINVLVVTGSCKMKTLHKEKKEVQRANAKKYAKERSMKMVIVKIS